MAISFALWPQVTTHTFGITMRVFGRWLKHLHINTLEWMMSCVDIIANLTKQLRLWQNVKVILAILFAAEVAVVKIDKRCCVFCGNEWIGTKTLKYAN